MTDKNIEGSRYNQTKTNLTLRTLYPVEFVFLAAVIGRWKWGGGNYSRMAIASVIVGVCIVIASVVSGYLSLFKSTSRITIGRRFTFWLLYFPSVSVAFLSSIYLFFYKGLWGFVALRYGISFTVIAKASFFTYAGYKLVAGISADMDFDRAVGEGRLQVGGLKSKFEQNNPRTE
jgi:hypothetical protein